MKHYDIETVKEDIEKTWQEYSDKNGDKDTTYKAAFLLGCMFVKYDMLHKDYLNLIDKHKINNHE